VRDDFSIAVECARDLRAAEVTLKRVFSARIRNL
jgi:hypothetical protein